jgi:hypothetical protein
MVGRKLRHIIKVTLLLFPAMLLEEKALKSWIDNFYGYGAWHAKFWFVNYEESGGDLPEEVAEKLNYFYNLQGRKHAHALRHPGPLPSCCIQGGRTESFEILKPQRSQVWL